MVCVWDQLEILIRLLNKLVLSYSYILYNCSLQLNSVIVDKHVYVQTGYLSKKVFNK